MKIRLPVNLEPAAWGVAFSAAYILLDWVTYIRPLQHLNVTPWNPSPALALLFLIRQGRAALPYVYGALVIGDILVRDIPGGLAMPLGVGLQLTIGYAAIAWLLQRSMPEKGMFCDRRSLLSWSLIVIGGTLLNSVAFVITLWAGDLLSTENWGDALRRFWIGDCVGIFVTLPLFWALQDSLRRKALRTAIFRWETIGYLVLTLITLWIAFVPGAQAQFRYFYVLFLPIVWAASRQGLAGAIFCVPVVQIGMMLAGLLHSPTEISLLELQMRAFLLAIVGFLIGVAVDEQRRASAELRQSLRLAAAGEMAGALAHELNQPLSALTAYSSACLQLIERKATREQLRDVATRINSEAARAAEVLRRLRDFFRTGATKLGVVSLAEIIDAVIGPFRTKAGAKGLEFEIGSIPPVSINVDRLQVELVLRNLLANAFEATAEGRIKPPQVALTSFVEPGGGIVIEVADNGPGVAPEMADQLFEPFASSKSNGLGLGLAISRAIAEAHGGSLTAIFGERTCFRLKLPIETRTSPTYG